MFVNILLSNDDGYKSLGLIALRERLNNFGKVLTIAPHKDISASSSSLSVHNPVKVQLVSRNFYKAYGTPADCVHIATRGLLIRYPDIVFSGINFGSNMGDDVVYSGTVGAAIEGRHAKFGSYAISIASRNPIYKKDIDKNITYVLDYIFDELIRHKSIFNINIPDIPFSKVKGFKITKLGTRNISKRAKKAKKNIMYYNIGEVGKGNLLPNSDFDAIKKNYISVTPINIDMTDNHLYKKIKT